MAGDDPRVWLAEARRLHRAGDAAGALAGYTRVLDRLPRHPEVLQLAAMAAAQSDDLQIAESLARRALDVRGDAAARLTLGRVLLQAGNLEEALSCLNWISTETPLAADAAYHSGQALRRLGRTEEAEQALLDATSQACRHAPAWNELGVVRLQLGLSELAIACFEESLKIRPGHAPTLTNLANARFKVGDYAGCDRDIGAALAAATDPTAAEALLGRLRKTQGRLPEARAIWQSLVDRHPDDTDAWHGLASTLQAAGDLELAGECYDKALVLEPGRADLVAARAEWLEWQGRYEEGLEALSALDTGQRELAGPMLVRARLQRRVGRVDQARSTLETAVPQTEGNTPLRRQFCFSLGDVCDELEDYGAAWRWYTEGNRLGPAAYEGQAHRRWLQMIEERSSGPAQGETGAGVVFIVGMPRSGTSLIEHILAAHPSVLAAGELSILGGLVQTMVCADQPSPDTMTRVGRSYLAALPARGAGQTHITDKMPTNFSYLPVIHAALPGARVVHCRRDPMDSGLSCFFTDFIDPTLAFSARLEWLADYIHTYQTLMGRWVPRFGARLLEIDYERLVRRPEQGVRELLEFLGLAWDDRCLQSHEQERVMMTASHAQVREPIHTRSIGRWRHYRTHLGPLLEMADRSDQSTSA